jgi:hypothetical protein
MSVSEFSKLLPPKNQESSDYRIPLLSRVNRTCILSVRRRVNLGTGIADVIIVSHDFPRREVTTELYRKALFIQKLIYKVFHIMNYFHFHTIHLLHIFGHRHRHIGIS